MYTFSCAHTSKRVTRPRDAFPVILLMIQCSSRRWWIRGSWNTVITQVLIKHFMLRIATYLLWVWVFERNEKSKVILIFSQFLILQDVCTISGVWSAIAIYSITKSKQTEKEEDSPWGHHQSFHTIQSLLHLIFSMLIISCRHIRK